ncbi:hypothetical protein [Mycetohabitans rhizoxinica]|uniref:hypothetical protein n=1 Tax=Mycetohabitans rhizoxinica TaxID=412963 RepID=UPI0030D0F772
MFKYTPKYQVKVDGKMNSTDAGIVARRLANAALILAAGAFCFGFGIGIGYIVHAIRWW